MVEQLAIIGAGDVVAKRLLPALRQYGALSKVQIFHNNVDDVSPTLSNDAWQTISVSTIDGRTPEDLARLPFDAVFVATPPDAHIQYVEAFLGSGCPVICEKPLFIQSTDKLRFVRLGKALKRLFALSYYVQEKALPLAWLCGHDPDAGNLVLARGTATRAELRKAYVGLGKIRSIDVAICEGALHARTRTKPFWYEMQYDGVWFDMGVHALMLPMMLTRKPLVVETVNELSGPSYVMKGHCGEVSLTVRFGKGFPNDQALRRLVVTYENGKIVGDLDSLCWRMLFSEHADPFEISILEPRLRYGCLVKKSLNFLNEGGIHTEDGRTDSLDLQLEAIEALDEIWRTFLG